MASDKFKVEMTQLERPGDGEKIHTNVEGNAVIVAVHEPTLAVRSGSVNDRSNPPDETTPPHCVVQIMGDPVHAVCLLTQVVRSALLEMPLTVVAAACAAGFSEAGEDEVHELAKKSKNKTAKPVVSVSSLRRNRTPGEN